MSGPFTTVLGLLALDDRDHVVLDGLAALALQAGCERILLLHVHERTRRFGLASWLPAGASVASPTAPDELVSLLQERVSKLAEAVGAHVVGIQAAGRATEEVARVVEKEGVDLVVVGRSVAPSGGTGWGEHGLRVLRLADAPVLVIPDGAAPRFERIVVGMDLSEYAFDALAAAASLGGSVSALAVVDRAAEGLDDAAFFELEASLRDRYAALAGERLGGAEPPALEIVEQANPGDALLGWAEPAGAGGMRRADLLVVGSRGLTPMAAVLLGSTAETLGGRADLPLLVWRRKGHQRGVFSALFGG